jgi:beta-glucosidase
MLVSAVRSGNIPETAVDGHVRRILRLAARVGALEGVPAAVPTAPPWTDEQISAQLRATAAAGFVLARNKGSLLPLDADTVRKVAILGPNAALARALGGGSNRLPASCRLPTRRVAVRSGRRGSRWFTLPVFGQPSGRSPVTATQTACQPRKRRRDAGGDPATFRKIVMAGLGQPSARSRRSPHERNIGPRRSRRR